MKERWLIYVLVIMFSCSAWALGPHEILVLVNGNSPDSIEVARRFVELRRVPDVNVVCLQLPTRVVEPPFEIAPDDFSKLIWEPAIRAMEERGIRGHILAWVYSCDFPIRIKAEPVISILGLTFLRNKLPSPEKVKKENTYISSFFAGPVSPQGRPHYSQTFDVYREWLGEEVPLPAMMLGYKGEEGNTKGEILKCLKQGMASDGVAPTGTVYFITSENIRSTCRDWQFPTAQNRLENMGIKSVITNQFPAGAKDIIGLMIGAENVDPKKWENVYRPGCMAEHLTSCAAMFGSKGQTKLSVWIRAGVTASAGAVTEPFAVWMKFPSAMFYVHYASGCCVMESFYQAISCPLEILIIGDPLAKPWAQVAKMIIHGIDSKTVSGTVKVRPEVVSGTGLFYGKFMFLVDGRPAGDDKMLELDTTKLEDGGHILRVIGYSTGFVRNQVFSEKSFIIRNKGSGNKK